MRKLEAWCQSKMLVDFVVSAFIVHRGRVLLVEHKKLGLWMPPGGHIEPGELPDEALAREIREETGLILGETCYNVIRPAPVQSHLGAKKDATPGPHNRRPQIPVWTIEAHDYPPIPGHRHVALVYLLRATTNDVKLEEKSADGIGFFLPNVLPSPILESVEIYCQDAAVAAAGDIIPEGNV
jgi:8-oxo-dGTP pyrophosphatase MutT (NUDIX family)